MGYKFMGRRREDDSFEELQRRKKRKLQKHDERMRELNNPAKSAPQTGHRKKKKKTHKAAKRLGKVLVALQAILTILFLWIIFSLNILPMKYTVAVVAVLFVLFIIVYRSQRKHKGRAIAGKLLSLLIIVILGAGSYYLEMVNGAFDKVTGGTHKIDHIVVAVLKDDPAQSIEDTKNYTFGVQYEIGGEDIEETMDEINANVGQDVETIEFADIESQVAALFSGGVDAVVYNDGYTGMLGEEISGFESKIKIIYSHEIKKELERTTENIDVQNDTFNVYLSGIDVYGSISKSSRSDVNIIATVNPETRQILLITTPRDYYVTLPGVSDGQKDKLTHAGIYGVDASIAALENLYETEIPFYARVNFSSMIEIVDALGGIEVYSEYSFTTQDGYYVRKGMNEFDGEEALSFSRERKNLPDGDNQRGKNQQAVIVAMIKKMISPKILMSASSIIDSVSGNVETNMSESQIQSLIKMQLNEGGSWNICSVAAEGVGTTEYTYSMPSKKLYVAEPVEESIEEIMSLMKQVQKGEILDDSEVVE